MEEVVPHVCALRVLSPVEEERFIGIVCWIALSLRKRVRLEVVKINAVAADPVGEEVVGLHFVVGAGAQAVVPRSVRRIVLVAEARSVLEVEPIRILKLLPLVLIVRAAKLQRFQRAGLPRKLPDPGPGLAIVRGQDSVRKQPGLRGIPHLVRDDARPAILDILPLAGRVEGHLLHAWSQGAAHRGAEVLVAPALLEPVSEDTLRGSEVLLAAFLRHDVDRARIDAPVFGVESAGLDHDLFDRVAVDRRRRDARERILLREAIHVVGDLIGAAAANDQRVVVLRFVIDVQLEVDDARLLRHGILVAAERLILDVVSGEKLRGACQVLLDQGTLRLDDHFGHVRQHRRFDREVEPGVEVGDDLHVLPYLRDEAQERDSNRIVPGGNIQDAVVPLGVGHRPALQIRDRDAGERYRLPGFRIMDDPGQLSRRSSPRGAKHKNGAGQKDGRAQYNPKTRSKHDSPPFDDPPHRHFEGSPSLATIGP